MKKIYFVSMFVIALPFVWEGDVYAHTWKFHFGLPTALDGREIVWNKYSRWVWDFDWVPSMSSIH